MPRTSLTGSSRQRAAFARTVYSKLVRRLLDNGTTTTVYYASIHLEATKVLVDVCRELGQRAIVGKVAMDQHGGEGYVETTADALRDSLRDMGVEVLDNERLWRTTRAGGRGGDVLEVLKAMARRMAQPMARRPSR